jgi:hypothetical protein
VEGTSDDLDRPIAALFRDTEFKHQHRLGSLNSVNVARVLMQAVHYFYAYFCAVDEAQTVGFGSTRSAPAAGNFYLFSPSHSHISTPSQETLQFVIPTGAGGHITGGIIAQKMGLPISLCAATNENDIVHRLFSKGDLSVASEVGTGLRGPAGGCPWRRVSLFSHAAIPRRRWFKPTRPAWTYKCRTTLSASSFYSVRAGHMKDVHRQIYATSPISYF